MCGLHLFPPSLVHSIDIYLYNKNRFGRDLFQEALKLVGKSAYGLADIQWKHLKYMLFDIPNHPGTYADRYKILGKPKDSFICGSLYYFILFNIKYYLFFFL